MALAVPYEKTPGGRAERMQRARALFADTPGSASLNASDSLLGDVVGLMVEHFGDIYRNARGHQIDPIYLTALKHDVLIVVEKVALASQHGWGEAGRAALQQKDQA